MKNKEQHIFPFLERLLDGAEVEWKKLGEVAELKRGNSITKKTSKEGKYPVISGGQKPAYYIDRFNCDGETITVAGSGAYAGFVMFWNEPIFVSDAFSIKTEENLVLPRYVYHFLLNIQGKIYSLKTGSGVPHVYAKDVGLILIPIPCPSKPEKSIEIQRKIVEILDKFMTLEAELEAELDCRKRQYEYYRNQLLSFDMLNRGGQRLNNVSIMALGEVGEFIRGKRFVKTDITTQGCPCIHYGEMYTYYGIWANKSKSFISQTLVNKKNLRQALTNDVIIVGAGETIEDLGVGTAWLSQTPAVIHDACFIFRSSLNPKYVAYFTRTNNFHDQLRRHVSSGKISAVNAKGLSKIEIPVPPLSEQERIVSILDKFDTLVNSISEGLPKEIELRRKQYEYYRNQLLSFPEHKVSA